MPTPCGVENCKAMFDEVGDYAKHILEKHKYDNIRVSFANEILHPTITLEPRMTLKSIIFGNGIRV